MAITPQTDQEELMRRWNSRWPRGRQVCVDKEICRGATTGPAFPKDGEAVVMVEGLFQPVPLASVRTVLPASGPLALDLRLGLGPDPACSRRSQSRRVAEAAC